MAAYRADIQIGVSGQQELERLRSAITQTSEAAESLNRIRVNGGRLAQSLENYNTQLERARRNLEAVATASLAENKAITEYVTALGSANAARARQNDLIEDEIRLQQTAARVARLAAAGIRETSGTTQLGPGPASPVGSLVGQKSPVAERINQTLQARKDEIQLQAALLRLEEKSAAVLNEKVELQQRLNRAALAQGKIDVETVSAQQTQRQQFLAGKSGTAIQGPLAGPGAMGFPVALSLSKVEQQALETAAKKQEILQRMVATKQALVGLAANLQRLDLNSSVAIADAVRSQTQLNAAKTRQLQITKQIRASEGAASSAARQRLAQEAARRDRIQNAGFGIQGPALPPTKKGDGAGAGSSRLGGAISGSIIGGSFPLLFGQGAGAAAGGAVGGLVGGLAGPGGSFAGSLLGTLLGDIASKGQVIQDLADDMGLATEQTKQLAAAFQAAGADADKFGAAVQTIRGIGFADEEQVEVIKLVSKLTEDYGGKIDKVAAAYGNFAAKGKVGIADINKFTAQGIPILDELEKKYGKNRDQILALAKAGKITAQDLSNALVEIANRSEEVAKRTTSSFERTFENLKKGAGTSVSAIAIVLGNLVGVSTNVTGNIFEAFSSLYLNLVNGAVEAAARISDSLASIANNIAAFYKANPLVIPALRDAAVSGLESFKAGARGTSKQLRELTKQSTGVGQIAGPQIPGQLPPSDGGGKKAADRSKQIFQDILRLRNQIREAYLDQAKAAVQATEFSEGEAAAVALQLNKFEEISKVRIDILDTERTLAMASVESGEQASLINQLYKSKLQLLKDQNTLEQKQLQRKAAELALEKQLAAISREQAIEDVARPIQQQQDSTRLGIAAFTQFTQVTEQQNLALEQRNRLEEGQLPIIRERMRLEEEIASGAFTGTALQTKQDDLDASTRKLGVLREELGLLDQLEQRQLRLQQFYATYGQLIQSVSGEIANAVTFGVAEMVKGTKTAKEVFADFLNAIGAALISAAQQMIATYIAIGIAKMFAGMGGGGGNAASALGSNPNVAAYSSLPAGAKGATFANGIATFAKGGTFSNSIVSSPTMFKFADGGTTRTGLMGEAGPEAIMPLKRGPDGSLGVQANGLREAMGRPPGGANGSTVLNMSFQSTTINGTEYVSRDQLEAAMAATRRQAAKDGASRGMNMTLDKIQNSPSTRSRVGIR